jgi:hypothetical protein
MMPPPSEKFTVRPTNVDIFAPSKEYLAWFNRFYSTCLLHLRLQEEEDLNQDLDRMSVVEESQGRLVESVEERRIRKDRERKDRDRHERPRR